MTSPVPPPNPNPTPLIRPATHSEIPALAEIETSAAHLFHTISLPHIATGSTIPASILTALIASGTVWVAEFPDSRTPSPNPIGFLAAKVLNNHLHIDELSVAAEYQRQGIGKALVEFAGNFAKAKGLKGLSLVTFRDVEWNGIWYARIGFREMRDGDWEGGEEEEGLKGLLKEDPFWGGGDGVRVVMVRYGEEEK